MWRPPRHFGARGRWGWRRRQSQCRVLDEISTQREDARSQVHQSSGYCCRQRGRVPFKVIKLTDQRTCLVSPKPFPMNPTFAPLPPLADTIKTNIYNAYTFNILEAKATDSQVIRAVSSKFGVGMDRVRAIVRLKELEKKWKDEVRPFFWLLFKCCREERLVLIHVFVRESLWKLIYWSKWSLTLE